MARQNHGPLSRAKGKLGGVVYQQYEGMQISREYQPVVKNPQTTKQTENRAKFKTASQITAQFAEVINARLAKLSIYTRQRRAASVNAIYAAASIDHGTTAALFEDVVANINAKSMSVIEAPAVADGTGTAKTITATNGDVVIYVACSYDESGKLIKREEEKFTSDGTAKSVMPDANANTFSLMAVAMRASTEEGRATLGNITGYGTKWELNISRAVAAGDVEVSDIAGSMDTLD